MQIAIVGKAENSLRLAPWNDPDWEIWILGDMTVKGEAPRFDRHFELHGLDDLVRCGAHADYIGWLTRERSQPTYLLEGPDERIPASVGYPLKQVIDEFGTYFTSTVAWMLALAIREAPRKIGVWGVDMAENVEYRQQRASCEWFLGIAFGRGIDLFVPPESSLLKSRVMYGFDADTGDFRKYLAGRIEHVGRRRKRHEAEFQKHRDNSIYLKGYENAARQMCQWELGQADECRMQNDE